MIKRILVVATVVVLVFALFAVIQIIPFFLPGE
jgi:hypothetical protein